VEFIYKVSKRRSLFILVDLIIILASYFISYVLRFYPDILSHQFLLKPLYFVMLFSSYFISFYLFQIYRIIWEYSNIKDVYKLCIANITSFLIFIFIVFIFKMNYSRLVFILTFFFILIGTVFYRVIIRDYFSKKSNRKKNKVISGEQHLKTRKILIVGAGEAGRTILAELDRKGLSKSVVGFIDDDLRKIGKI